MRDNGEPPLYASKNPELFVILEGEPPQAICPNCNRCLLFERDMIRAHRTRLHGRDRCDGSGQQVLIDLNPTEWQRRFAELSAELQRKWRDAIDADARRGNAVHHKPELPAQPAVHQIAAGRTK